MLERVSAAVRGEWFDVFRFADGRETHGPHGEFRWRPNQIQNTFATLLAIWARGEAGYSRINHMALGEGLVSWDSVPPAQPFAQAALTTEAFRKVIPQVDIAFIDPNTNLPTGGVPSNKLRITSVIGGAEANGLSLREFGLFGGSSTLAFDSGEMVNWVAHARIDKDASFEIDRTVRLLFVTQ
jgi:hypothetical protein